MNRAAGDEAGLAGGDVDGFAFDGEGDDACEAVDGFVVAAVRMRHGHFGARGGGEFEHRQRAAGVGGFEEESNFDLADADDFVFHRGFLHCRGGPTISMPYCAAADLSAAMASGEGGPDEGGN